MKKWIVILTLTLISGCATYSPIIPVAEKERIKTLRVISLVPQEEIKIQINQANSGAAAGAQFGLLGALVGGIVDASVEGGRAKKSESYADLLRNTLMGEDVTSKLHESVRQGVKDIDWADVTKFEVRRKLDREDKKALATEMEEDAVLIITSTYSLTPKQEIIEVDSISRLYEPKTPSAGKKYKILSPVKGSSSVLRFQSDFASEDLKKVNAEISKIQKEYDEKKVGKSGDGLKKLNSWRKDSINAIRKEAKVKNKQEVEAIWAVKKAEIEEKYDQLLAAEKSKTKRQSLLKEKRKELKLANAKAKENEVVKRNQEWVKNEGELLKEQINIGIKQTSVMLNKALNSDIPKEKLSAETQKIATGTLENEAFHGFINGYLLNSSAKGDREIYMLKAASGTAGQANYISIAKGNKVYQKVMRQ